MDSLNTIPNSGSFGDVSAKLNDNFSKVGQSLTTLENVAIANKGYFDTLASLQAAFPSPKAGNIAYVANVASSTGYYIYNVVSGVWTATTTEAPAVDVAISNYAQHGYSSSPKTLKQVDDEVVQLAGDVNQLAYVKIKNEAVNGNLENGLIAPFYKADGQGGESTLAINSSTPISGNYDIRLTITTPATPAGRPAFYGLNRAANIGDKIYLHFNAKILSGIPIITSIHNGLSGQTIYGGDVINGRNTRIIDVAGTDSYLGMIYFNSLSVWDMQMDNFMRINLTETFGVGNEPTEEEMNLLLDIAGISYIDDETIIAAQKVMHWQLANTALTETTLSNQQTMLANQLPFLRGGLPMILNTSSLVDEVSQGRTLTPSIMSNFLLDFKLEGTAEPGMTYVLGFQYQKTGGSYPYSNYLAVYKKDISNVKTIAADLYVGNNAPVGKQLINIPIKSGYTYLTKATVYLDYDALNVLEAGTSAFSGFNLASYNFNQTYIFDLNIGPLAEKAQVQQQIEDVETLVIQADAKATQANEKITTEETTTWELANDLTFFTSQYGYRNLGQYTKVLTEAVAFSQVRLNLVSHAGDVQYKVCIVNGIASRRDCPVGPISPSTHTIIKEGTLTLTTGYKDYFIDLGNVFVCPSGSQVAIYMVSVSGNTIGMRGSSGGLGNPEKTSNVALFSSSDSPFDGGSWVAGSVTEETNIGFYNVALSLRVVPIFMTKDNLDEDIQEQVELLVPDIIKPDIKLTIPDKVYAVVGTELNLWNDAVSLSVDKGLSSPLNYQVRWYCTKGLVTDRCFRFTPTDLDVGTVSCTCYLYDMRGSLIDSKTFSIIVSAKNAISSAKNIVYFGDSLGSSVATALYNNFNNVDKFTGVAPTMLGTEGTSIKYQAVGGYRWEDYATEGRIAHRVNVVGIGAIGVGSLYSNNGYTFRIAEVNITSGDGNLLLTGYSSTTAVPIIPSGTLMKVSGTGDASITYSGAEATSSNPLWNETTNQLDVLSYKAKIGLSPTDKIDAVSFQFGINDNSLANDLTTLMTYIDDLYNAFIADNPLCKFIIGLTTSSGNDVNGAGSNYGASYDWKTYIENTYKIRQFYLTLQNSASYPNIIIAPVSLGLDRYYGYALGERPISQRVPEIEKYHNNYVHPGGSGYGQMADMYFGTYIYAVTQ